MTSTELNDLVHWYVPEVFGSVQDRFEGTSGKVVFHITDTHANYESQANTVKILEGLIRDRFRDKLRLIGVEGAAGRVDVSRFKAYPDQEIIAQIADYFLRQAFLTGSDSFGIAYDGPLTLQGVEDADLYVDDWKAFVLAHEAQSQLDPILNNLKSVFQKLSGAVYGPEALKFAKFLASHQAGQIGFSGYCEDLASFAAQAGVFLKPYTNYDRVLRSLRIEKSLAGDAVEKERTSLIEALEKKMVKEDLAGLVSQTLLYRTGKISSMDFYAFLDKAAQQYAVDWNAFKNLQNYMQMVRLQNELRTKDLFSECEQIENEIKEKLFKAGLEKDFDAAGKRLAVLDSLVHLRLNRAELSFYQRHQEAVGGGALAGFLTQVLSARAVQTTDGWQVDTAQGRMFIPKSFLADAGVIDRNLDSMQSFYKTALERDEALVRNTLQNMEKNGLATAVLITGGFHTEGTMKLLKEKGISYVVVNPRLTKTDQNDLYTARMLNEELPLQKFLGAQRSGLAIAEALSAIPLRGRVDSPGGKTYELDSSKAEQGLYQTLHAIFIAALARKFIQEGNVATPEQLEQTLGGLRGLKDMPLAIGVEKVDGDQLRIRFAVSVQEGASAVLPAEFFVSVSLPKFQTVAAAKGMPAKIAQLGILGDISYALTGRPEIEAVSAGPSLLDAAHAVARLGDRQDDISRRALKDRVQDLEVLLQRDAAETVAKLAGADIVEHLIQKRADLGTILASGNLQQMQESMVALWESLGTARSLQQLATGTGPSVSVSSGSSTPLSPEDRAKLLLIEEAIRLAQTIRKITPEDSASRTLLQEMLNTRVHALEVDIAAIGAGGSAEPIAQLTLLGVGVVKAILSQEGSPAPVELTLLQRSLDLGGGKIETQRDRTRDELLKDWGTLDWKAMEKGPEKSPEIYMKFKTEFLNGNRDTDFLIALVAKLDRDKPKLLYARLLAHMELAGRYPKNMEYRNAVGHLADQIGASLSPVRGPPTVAETTFFMQLLLGGSEKAAKDLAEYFGNLLTAANAEISEGEPEWTLDLNKFAKFLVHSRLQILGKTYVHYDREAGKDVTDSSPDLSRINKPYYVREILVRWIIDHAVKKYPNIASVIVSGSAAIPSASYKFRVKIAEGSDWDLNIFVRPDEQWQAWDKEKRAAYLQEIAADIEKMAADFDVKMIVPHVWSEDAIPLLESQNKMKLLASPERKIKTFDALGTYVSLHYAFTVASVMHGEGLPSIAKPQSGEGLEHILHQLAAFHESQQKNAGRSSFETLESLAKYAMRAAEGRMAEDPEAWEILTGKNPFDYEGGYEELLVRSAEEAALKNPGLFSKEDIKLLQWLGDVKAGVYAPKDRAEAENLVETWKRQFGVADLEAFLEGFMVKMLKASVTPYSFDSTPDHDFKVLFDQVWQLSERYENNGNQELAKAVNSLLPLKSFFTGLMLQTGNPDSALEKRIALFKLRNMLARDDWPESVHMKLSEAEQQDEPLDTDIVQGLARKIGLNTADPDTMALRLADLFKEAFKSGDLRTANWYFRLALLMNEKAKGFHVPLTADQAKLLVSSTASAEEISDTSYQIRHEIGNKISGPSGYLQLFLHEVKDVHSQEKIRDAYNILSEIPMLCDALNGMPIPFAEPSDESALVAQKLLALFFWGEIKKRMERVEAFYSWMGEQMLAEGGQIPKTESMKKYYKTFRLAMDTILLKIQAYDQSFREGLRKPEPKAIRLAPKIHEAIQRIHPSEDIAVSLPEDMSVEVMGDDFYMETVLDNLIKNAVEAMKGVPGAQLQVRLQASDDKVGLMIKDNGTGIDPVGILKSAVWAKGKLKKEDRRKLCVLLADLGLLKDASDDDAFGKLSSYNTRELLQSRFPEGIPSELKKRMVELIFMKHVSSKAEKGEGMGVGLDLVKLMVERLGGNISIVTELGKGTMFVIMLSRAKTAGAEARVPAVASPAVAPQPLPESPPLPVDLIDSLLWAKLEAAFDLYRRDPALAMAKMQALFAAEIQQGVDVPEMVKSYFNNTQAPERRAFMDAMVRQIAGRTSVLGMVTLRPKPPGPSEASPAAHPLPPPQERQPERAARSYTGVLSNVVFVMASYAKGWLLPYLGVFVLVTGATALVLANLGASPADLAAGQGIPTWLSIVEKILGVSAVLTVLFRISGSPRVQAMKQRYGKTIATFLGIVVVGLVLYGIAQHAALAGTAATPSPVTILSPEGLGSMGVLGYLQIRDESKPAQETAASSLLPLLQGSKTQLGILLHGQNKRDSEKALSEYLNRLLQNNEFRDWVLKNPTLQEFLGKERRHFPFTAEEWYRVLFAYDGHIHSDLPLQARFVLAEWIVDRRDSLQDLGMAQQMMDGDAKALKPGGVRQEALSGVIAERIAKIQASESKMAVSTKPFVRTPLAMPAPAQTKRFENLPIFLSLATAVVLVFLVVAIKAYLIPLAPALALAPKTALAFKPFIPFFVPGIILPQEPPAVEPSAVKEATPEEIRKALLDLIDSRTDLFKGHFDLKLLQSHLQAHPRDARIVLSRLASIHGQKLADAMRTDALRKLVEDLAAGAQRASESASVLGDAALATVTGQGHPENPEDTVFGVVQKTVSADTGNAQGTKERPEEIIGRALDLKHFVTIIRDNTTGRIVERKVAENVPSAIVDLWKRAKNLIMFSHEMSAEELESALAAIRNRYGEPGTDRENFVAQKFDGTDAMAAEFREKVYQAVRTAAGKKDLSLSNIVIIATPQTCLDVFRQELRNVLFLLFSGADRIILSGNIAEALGGKNLGKVTAGGVDLDLVTTDATPNLEATALQLAVGVSA